MGMYPELPWIQEAKKHVGLKEIKGSKHNLIILGWLLRLKAWWANDETAWCGVFVAFCLQSVDIKVPKNWMRALDYLNYGTKLNAPAYGCVAVKSRVGGGHVGFVVGKTPSGKIVVLGGNQSDMVCYALYDESEFQYRWYGYASQPAEHRYTLPVLTNITKTNVTES